MAYLDKEFPTKKAFKAAVAAGEEVKLLPNYFGGDGTYAPGRAAVSGPGGGKPNKWYADIQIDPTTKVVTKIVS